MAFDESQLDEIRSKIKIYDVISRFYTLRKQGSEYVKTDDTSFTVSPSKNIYWDFGKGDGGGDAIDFLTREQGYTFVGAVEELANQAGVTLRQRPGRSGPERNGADHPPIENRPSRDDAPKGKREVTATWDYVDNENTLLYQVVRMQERMPDGEWKINREGKVWKTFMQRRPSPEGDGSWVLGLDFIDRETDKPLEFLRTPKSQAWMRATPERLGWSGITVRTFPNSQNVDHWLYGANDVLDELQEHPEDQRIIFMPEGEGKVDILREWGLIGVTNSGGAKNFTENCAEIFRNARQVVLLQDNDRAGAERIGKIAPMLKAVGVQNIQSLNFRDVWTKCPDKGDIKNWRDDGGGTRDRLLEIVDKLPQWVPEPYRSKFGAKTSADLAAPAKPYPWRIKGIAPLNDTFLVMGPSQSGKTFEMLDIAMHICTAKATFSGRKVVPGGVVYLAYEGTSGFENRVRAYMHHHGLTDADLHSFAWLTRPPNLFTDEANVEALGQEILEIGRTFKLPLGVVIIDTHNASTRGSSEIKSDDLGKIMSHHDMIADITGVKPWIIGHTNSEGKHRGSDLLYNTIETTMLIERVHENNDLKKPERRDDSGRVIRQARMKKQRDGSDDIHWQFVLQQVEIGKDEDGDPITSMVSVEPATADETRSGEPESIANRPEGVWLSDTMVSQFQALLRALDDRGVPPPPSLQLPRSVNRVITSSDLGFEWRRKETQEEGETYQKYMARTKASLNRFKQKMGIQNAIGIDHVDRSTADKKDITYYIWTTGRRVRGRQWSWPNLPRKKDKVSTPAPLLAPGESAEDIQP